MDIFKSFWPPDQFHECLLGKLRGLNKETFQAWKEEGAEEVVCGWGGGGRGGAISIQQRRDGSLMEERNFDKELKNKG